MREVCLKRRSQRGALGVSNRPCATRRCVNRNGEISATIDMRYYTPIHTLFLRDIEKYWRASCRSPQPIETAKQISTVGIALRGLSRRAPQLRFLCLVQADSLRHLRQPSARVIGHGNTRLGPTHARAPPIRLTGAHGLHGLHCPARSIASTHGHREVIHVYGHAYTRVVSPHLPDFDFTQVISARIVL